MKTRTLNIIVLSILFFLAVSCGHREKKGDEFAKGNMSDGPKNRVGQRQGRGLRHGFGRRGSKSSEILVHLTGAEKRQISIRTVKVSRKPVKTTLKAMGKILPQRDRKAIVGFSCPARISRFHVSVGDWVKHNQPLVTLECESVGAAKSDFFKACTDYELARQHFVREERLYKKDIGAQKDYLTAQAEMQIAMANLEATEKRLLILGFDGAAVREIKKNKDLSPSVKVRSPISGRVSRNNAVLGAMTDASTEIMSIIDPTVLWIDAEIFEKDLSKVKLGQTVDIFVPAYPEEIFKGRLHYVGDLVHEDTRTISVRTRVDNKNFKLKPGMFADINILLDQKTDAITIPLQTLLDEGDQKIVFVEKGNMYEYRVVKTGVVYDGQVEIVAGLEVGEIVVIEGHYQLKSRLQADSISHSH